MQTSTSGVTTRDAIRETDVIDVAKSSRGSGAASRRGVVAAFVIATVTFAGCTSTTSTPSPTPAASASVTSPSSAPPASTPEASSRALPTPTAASTPASWREAPSQPSYSGVEFQDVVWTGSTFVAAGSEGEQAVFVDSTDGTAWHRQTEPGKGGPTDLAASPGRVVGVGVIGGRLASWTSPDGLTWQAHPKAFPRAPNGSGFDEDWVQVTDVVAADEGWLAVGRRDPACQFDCGLDPKRAYVWTSRDGASWTRVPDQKAFNGGGMDAVARGTNGFVAAGVAAGRAAFWTSADGLAWSRVPDDALFHAPKDMGLTAIDVAADGGLLVAIGTFSSQDAARVRAWWSADGRTWTKASVEQPTDAAANGVTATPDGFLAPGWSVGCPGGSPVDPSSSHGAIWASNDGQTWRCDFPDVGPRGFSPSAAAASDSVEVAVGSTDPSEEDEESSPPRQGAIWYRTRP